MKRMKVMCGEEWHLSVPKPNEAANQLQSGGYNELLKGVAQCLASRRLGIKKERKQ